MSRTQIINPSGRQYTTGGDAPPEPSLGVLAVLRVSESGRSWTKRYNTTLVVFDPSMADRSAETLISLAVG